MHLARVANGTLLVLAAAAVIMAAPLISAAAPPLPAHAARPPQLPKPAPDASLPEPAASSASVRWPDPPTCPPARIEEVGVVGDPVPGLPGFTWLYFLLGQIDASGNVLFSAYLDGPGWPGGRRGVFYGPPGEPSILMLEGEQAPDMPEGVLISDLWFPGECVSRDGYMAMSPLVAGPGITAGVNDAVLYVGWPGEFCRVMQSGDQAPGCETGVYISAPDGIGFGGLLSENGVLFICADLDGPGITTYNNRAFWIGTADSFSLVYRDGMQAPGCPPGVVFLAQNSTVFNDAGEINFGAILRGPGVTSSNQRYHCIGGPGELTLICRDADPAPFFGPGVTWKTVDRSVNCVNALGDAVELAFIQGDGVTTANDDVLLVSTDDGFVLLGREGDPAPDAGRGVTVLTSGMCLVNNRREAFYRVLYGGAGIDESNQWAMYLGPYGAARQTMRDGDPAPFFPAGTTLWRINAMTAFTLLNSSGDVCAPTQIAGPSVTDADKVVLWLRHHVVCRWVPLLRSGAPLGERTVFAADEDDFGYGYYRATGGADGQPQSMNELGQVVIRLEFTDGAHGLFRISPPVFGDFDADGDVNQTDCEAFAACVLGPGGQPAPQCAIFDLDGDTDLDLADWAMLQQFVGAP